MVEAVLACRPVCCDDVPCFKGKFIGGEVVWRVVCWAVVIHSNKLQEKEETCNENILLSRIMSNNNTLVHTSSIVICQSLGYDLRVTRI